MTRFARMPKKQHLEASSWAELSRQHKVKQEETTNDEKQEPNEDSKPETKIKKKKSKKRNLETEDSKLISESEPVSSPKKQKITDSNTSESKIKRKKGKKKELFQPKDKKRTTSKDTLEVDSTKAGEGQGMKVKFVSSRKAEKLEKQREARRRRRAKKKGITCFHCRQLGHRAVQCPQMNQEGTGIGVCYKCGSSDHTTRNCNQKGTKKGGNPFPFAKCFICGDVGHLSSGCPDNPKGLYPNGGGCRLCGSVEHLKRDCREAITSKKKDVKSASHSFKSSKFTSADAEVHSDDEEPHLPKHYKKNKTKTVKF